MGFQFVRQWFWRVPMWFICLFVCSLGHICCRVDDFEFTRERAIFDLLDIPLYHGWIVDPQVCFLTT